MCQAQRWLTDPVYNAVMITHPKQVFIRDFVIYSHHKTLLQEFNRLLMYH